MAVSKEEKDMMMKRLKTPLAGLLAGFLAVTTSLASGEVQLEGAKVGQWTMDFAAAAKLAKEKLTDELRAELSAAIDEFRSGFTPSEQTVVEAEDIGWDAMSAGDEQDASETAGAQA